MLKLVGDSIYLDDFEVARILDDIPPSQRHKLERTLDQASDLLTYSSEICDGCGNRIVGK